MYKTLEKFMDTIWYLMNQERRSFFFDVLDQMQHYQMKRMFGMVHGKRLVLQAQNPENGLPWPMIHKIN